jgi:hypothetical protein
VTSCLNTNAITNIPVLTLSPWWSDSGVNTATIPIFFYKIRKIFSIVEYKIKKFKSF